MTFKDFEIHIHYFHSSSRRKLLIRSSHNGISSYSSLPCLSNNNKFCNFNNSKFTTSSQHSSTLLCLFEVITSLLQALVFIVNEVVRSYANAKVKSENLQTHLRKRKKKLIFETGPTIR